MALTSSSLMYTKSEIVYPISNLKWVGRTKTKMNQIVWTKVCGFVTVFDLKQIKPNDNGILNSWIMCAKGIICVNFDYLYSQISPQFHLISYFGGNYVIHKRCTRSKIDLPITHCQSGNLTTKTVGNIVFCVNTAYYHD